MIKFDFLFFGFLSLFSFGQICRAANSSMCSVINNFDAKKQLDFLEEMNCRELNTGEKKYVNIGQRFNNRTGLPANYILTKTGNKQYEIQIGINLKEPLWISLANQFKKMPEPDLKKQMTEKIQKCASQAADLLKGPNGEELSLRPMMSDVEKKSMPMLFSNSVSIEKDQNFRSHSHAYQKDIGCEVIIHELLHLTGLVDEYNEQDLSVISQGGMKFDCRVKGPITSVMFNHRLAYESVTDPERELRAKSSFYIEGQWCSEDNLCIKKELRIINENQNRSVLLQQYKQYYSAQSNVRLDESSVKIEKWIKKQNPQSILEPAHFRAIVYPGCQLKNALYYKCAQQAYRTSVKSTNLGPFTLEKNCNTPPECLSDDWLK